MIQELYPEKVPANEPMVEITSVSSNNHSPLTVPSYDSERSQDPEDSKIEMGPKLREAKNEYRYRTLLNHRHHSSRKSRIIKYPTGTNIELCSVLGALATCGSGNRCSWLPIETFWKLCDLVQRDKSLNIVGLTNSRHALYHRLW